VRGRGRRRGLLIGGIAGGGVLLITIIAVVAAASSPSPKPAPAATGTAVAPTQGATLTVPPASGPASTPPASTPAASPTASLAPGVTPISQLLPSGITDPGTQCQPQSLPLPFSAPGLVTAIRCLDPTLLGGEVFAIQSDSSADYKTTWRSYNKWLGFDASTAGTSCPPTSSNPQGVTEWKPKSESSYSKDQVLECGTLGTGSKSQPVYIWTLPKQDGFLLAQGAHATTLKALDSWWTNH